MPAKSPKGPPIPFPGKGNAFGKPQFVVDLTPFIEDGITSSIDIGSVDAPATKDAGSAAFTLTDDFTQSSNVRITNFSSDDLIQVSNNDGFRYVFGMSDLDNHDLVITRQFGTEVSWIVLDDVISDEYIAGGGIVFDYSSALSALSRENDFITYDDTTPTPPGECFEQSIDIGSILTGEDVTVNAAFAPFCFTDDPSQETSVNIFGLGPDDIIKVTGAIEGDYRFGTGSGSFGDPDDVVIVFNNGGTINLIVLKDAIVNPGFVSTYDEAVAAVGFEFMSFECIDQSIDVGTVLTPVSFDASLNAFCFTDASSEVTNIEIAGFGSNDLIQVSGASATDYNFARSSDDLNDLEITYSTGPGMTNRIVLDDVLPDVGPVVNYVQAVAAMGFDFMTFG